MDVLLKSFVKEKMREISSQVDTETKLPANAYDPNSFVTANDSEASESSDKKAKKHKKKRKKKKEKTKDHCASDSQHGREDVEWKKSRSKKKSESNKSVSKDKSKPKSSFYEEYEQVQHLLENGAASNVSEDLPTRADAYVSRRHVAEDDNSRKRSRHRSRSRSRRSTSRSKDYYSRKRNGKHSRDSRKRSVSSDSDFGRPRKYKKDDRSEVKTYILPQFNTNAFSSNVSSATSSGTLSCIGNKKSYLHVNGSSTTKTVEYNVAKTDESQQDQSIDHYVKMCRQIAKEEKDPNAKEEPTNVPWVSDGEDNNDASTGEWRRQDFVVKPANRIIQMNIPNANQLQLPVYRNTSELRVQFPVGSGEDHREHNQKIACGKLDKRDPTVEVVYKAPTRSSDPAKKPDINKLMREKAAITKQLEVNPYDAGALIKLHKLEKSIFEWSQPVREPGKFTGTTKVQCLSQKQLEGDDHSNGAWARKDMFKRLNKLDEVTVGPGKRLLERMGWRPGMSLGRTQRGATEPIDLNFNLDRKGLIGKGEVMGAGPVFGALGGLQGRHPVSVLEEHCRANGWGTPYFELVSESGPPHKRTFQFKVRVNNVDYIPHSGSGSKKQAKTDAAAGALFALGLT